MSYRSGACNLIFSQMQYNRLQVDLNMDSPVFNSAHKARAARSENMWAAPPSHHAISRNDLRSPPDRNALSTHLTALLQLEKHLRTFTQTCHKLYPLSDSSFIKSKRHAFRRFSGIFPSTRPDKLSYSALPLPSNARGRRESQKTITASIPGATVRWEVGGICARQVEEKLERVFWHLKENRLRCLLTGLAGLRTGVAMGCEEVRSLPNQEEMNNKMIVGTGSRLSNKRKTTKSGKERQDLKENSNYNITDLSVENQRLRNELINEEYERENFIEELSDLLERHEKFLSQGSTTNRTKKK